MILGLGLGLCSGKELVKFGVDAFWCPSVVPAKWSLITLNLETITKVKGRQLNNHKARKLEH